MAWRPFLIVLMFICISRCARTQGTRFDYTGLFSSLDKDKNSHVSTSEMIHMENFTGRSTWLPHYSTIFVKADSDMDFKLSTEEFYEWFAANERLINRIERDFTDGDKNQDGAMSAAEYRNSSLYKRLEKRAGEAWAEHVFRAMTRNNDMVVRKDMWWYFGSDDFGSADINKDHGLSEEEFLASPEHLHDIRHPIIDKTALKTEFSELDYNGDNHISLLEYNNHLQKTQIEDADMVDEDLGLDEEDRRDFKDVFEAMGPSDSEFTEMEMGRAGTAQLDDTNGAEEVEEDPEEKEKGELHENDSKRGGDENELSTSSVFASRIQKLDAPQDEL